MKEYYKKRKGWDDHKDGYDKKEYRPQAADQNINGREYGKRKGWNDHEGSMMKEKAQRYLTRAKYDKRKGWGDHGDSDLKYDGSKLRYEDGGIVKNPKAEALKNLRNQMEQLGGSSLVDSIKSKSENAYEDGGIVEQSESNESSEGKFDNLSREELLALLKNK